MIFHSQKQYFPLALSKSEQYNLDFSPVCDLFEGQDRLYLPGSRTVHIDFLSGEIKDFSPAKAKKEE
jgi:hypothetical protein